MKTQNFLLLLIFALCACTTPNGTEKSVSPQDIIIKPSKTFDTIDSISIGGLTSITQQENSIMFTEQYKHRVLVMDTAFKLKFILGGNKGAGPSDFAYPYSPVIKGKFIFVYDQGNQRISVFNKTNGKYIRNIKLVDRIVSLSRSFCIDDNNNIYFVTDTEVDGKMLVKLDSNGKLIKKFGEIIVQSKELQNQLMGNKRELTLTKNRVISVAGSYGIVEIFDLDGNKINTFDITANEPVKTTARLTQEDAKNTPDGSIIMNLYAYAREQRLYINIGDRSTDNPKKTVDLLVFNWSDKSCILTKRIKLNGDNYTGYQPFYVSNDEKTIYGQGSSSKNIYTFKMP